jgi:hypothetical protein
MRYPTQKRSPVMRYNSCFFQNPKKLRIDPETKKRWINVLNFVKNSNWFDNALLVRATEA